MDPVQTPKKSSSIQCYPKKRGIICVNHNISL